MFVVLIPEFIPRAALKPALGGPRAVGGCPARPALSETETLQRTRSLGGLALELGRDLPRQHPVRPPAPGARLPGESQGLPSVGEDSCPVDCEKRPLPGPEDPARRPPPGSSRRGSCLGNPGTATQDTQTAAHEGFPGARGGPAPLLPRECLAWRLPNPARPTAASAPPSRGQTPAPAPGAHGPLGHVIPVRLLIGPSSHPATSFLRGSLPAVVVCAEVKDVSPPPGPLSCGVLQ